MFTLNEDKSIYATRGDIVFFSVAMDDKGMPQKFKAGDVVHFKVYGKKDTENVVLHKKFPVTAETDKVQIYLERADTKIGDYISKPKDYWYSVTLNDDTNPQTIIGYDEDGAKVFKLFPEGADIPPYEPIKPEDIPVVDDELDLTSDRPVENKAIARAVVRLNDSIDKANKKATEMDAAIAVEKARLDNLIDRKDAEITQTLSYMEYITDETKSKLSAMIHADGVVATIRVIFHEANQFYGGSGMNVFIIPNECKPVDVGVIHTEDGIRYSILYDTENDRYVMELYAEDGALTAPSAAGFVLMTYNLSDYELKDIRVGADGTIYPTAGDAVRAQAQQALGDAVLYTPQDLTPEQQAQARANIGAAQWVPTVIVDEELDATSGNAVANSVVASAIDQLADGVDGMTEELSADITPLNSEVLNGYIIGDHKNPATNTWLETGSWRTTVIPVNTIVSLTRAVLNTNTISAYAVSFYSSDNISADSFISGLLFNDAGPAEFTDIVIPSNAVIAVFCDRVNHDNIVGDFTPVIEGVAKRVIKNVSQKIDNAVAELSAEIDNVGEEIDFVKSHITVPLTLDEATATRDCYINSDGTPTATTAWRSYLFDVSEVGGTLVSASVYSNSKAYYSISFYRENEIASEHLISGVLVSDTTIKTDFTDVPIPAGTKLVVISSRRNSGTDETAEVQVYAMAAMSKEIEGLAEKVREMDEAASALDDRVKKLEEESGEDLVADIETLRNEKSVDLMTDDFKFGNYYINSSGKMAGSGSWSGYAVAATYPKIVFNGYTNSVVNYVVGFYASDIPSDDTFISSLNVTPSTVVQEIIIDKSNTPEGTKSILFCTRVASGSDSSLVGVTTIVEQVNGLLADVEKLESDVAKVLVAETFGKGNIKAIYRDIPNNNDFAVVGDEIWFNQDYNGIAHVHRYKIVDGALESIVYNMHTDFGHWNTVDYCAENDCLVFGNAANDTNTEGNFFSVVPNPRAITGSITLADCAIRYPVNIGYKVQAVWGDTNFGKNNIVYLSSNNAQTITKVMLKQNEDGSFYKNPDTGEGEYIVLETAEQTTNIGVGGGDFWGDTLYIGDGVHHGWYEMSMSDYTVKHIKKNFYRDDATVISGCTQGVHLDSEYMWVYYNVGYANQERPNESYLVQYYR